MLTGPALFGPDERLDVENRERPNIGVWLKPTTFQTWP